MKKELFLTIILFVWQVRNEKLPPWVVKFNYTNTDSHMANILECRYHVPFGSEFDSYALIKVYRGGKEIPEEIVRNFHFYREYKRVLQIRAYESVIVFSDLSTHWDFLQPGNYSIQVLAGNFFPW